MGVGGPAIPPGQETRFSVIPSNIDRQEGGPESRDAASYLLPLSAPPLPVVQVGLVDPFPLGDVGLHHAHDPDGSSVQR